MGTGKLNLSKDHQAFVDRFIAVCRSDSRIRAAFIGGSYVTGTADPYSDLDLDIIISDDALEDFTAHLDDFLHLLGEPVFSETWGRTDMVSLIFADGTEGDLIFHRESDLAAIQSGPYSVLLDKKGLLAGIELPYLAPDPRKQAGELQSLILVFWHDMSHYIKAMQRDQLWFAQGELETLRSICINLARLQNDFFDTGVGDEPYFKVDEVLPVEKLSALKGTFCAFEKHAMLQSGLEILRFYQELAHSLAQAHGIPYPEKLERVMLRRLEELQNRLA